MGCLAACKKEDDPVVQNPVIPSGGLEIDLSKPENSALNSVGGSLVKSGVIVVQTDPDVFIALAVNCTHQGTPVDYVQSPKKFHCPNHGSEFSTTGSVLVGPANKALKKYTVSKSGTVLTIS